MLLFKDLVVSEVMIYKLTLKIKINPMNTVILKQGKVLSHLEVYGWDFSLKILCEF